MKSCTEGLGLYVTGVLYKLDVYGVKRNMQTYHVPVECRKITGIVGVDVATE